MKRMLFNATHAEELRVATVDGQKLIDFDVEVAGKEQKKSNIYKGVVTRVEQSLEACFVNYGEERHGFLPFKEIAKEFQKNNTSASSEFRSKFPISEGTELLVQIEKEERGNKGAALTTFISLAGRYLVLMPNNPRGGGVSRRIEGEERQELKDAIDKLDLTSGMSVIARTAGIGRSVEELKWDLTYLTQLWNAISGARSIQQGAYLIYQESSLVIRAIRDYFHPEVGEILVDTDDIFNQAKQFMQYVMPDMEPRVKKYSEDFPLYSRFQIEHQIETAYSRVVQLPLGGAIVIDHTEALVAVDVNSARSTRGSDIEDTAFKTNLEAAEEIGRQLRLRDLGGLIVIDFIDMESTKNQRDVEQCLKDSLSIDRARVQMGKISRFGLVELSRQRLRPALNEGSHITCARCNGVGVIRDINSSALHILRIIQEESMKDGTSSIYVQVPIEVATFLLNEKRTDLATLEVQLKVTIVLIPNKFLETPNYSIERLKFEDPKLDENKPSYKITEQPSSEVKFVSSKDAKNKKVSQKAVIKGVATKLPAPVNKNRTNKFFNNVFRKILGLFTDKHNTKKRSVATKQRVVNRRRNKVDQNFSSTRKTNPNQTKDRRKNSARIHENARQNTNLNKDKTDRQEKNKRKEQHPRAKTLVNNENGNSNSLDIDRSKDDTNSAKLRADEKNKSNLNERQLNDKNKRKKRKPVRKEERIDNSPKSIENKTVYSSEETSDESEKVLDVIASPTISLDVLNENKKSESRDHKKETANIKDTKPSLNANSKKKNESLKKLELDIESSGLEWIQTKQQDKFESTTKEKNSEKLGRKITRKKVLIQDINPLEMVETKKTDL